VVVLVAFGSFLTTMLGGLTALRVKDRRHLVLGLSGGLMLGVVGLDLLPEALATQSGRVFGVPAPMLTFVLGFLTLHLIEHSVAIHRGHEDEYAEHSHTHGHGQGVGVLAAAPLIGHSLADGFAIGAAFQAGSTVGAVVAVAVLAHDFADGFNTFTIAALYGNERRRALGLLAADALAPVIGAALTLAVTIPDGVLGTYLGFFAGFLLYLAACDILPEAHADHPTQLTLASTVLGVAVMWLVIGLAG
jgi:ZIP family zinc transporter